MKIAINERLSDKCALCGEKKPLIKTFRATMVGTDEEQVGASWECEDCIER